MCLDSRAVILKVIPCLMSKLIPLLFETLEQSLPPLYIYLLNDLFFHQHRSIILPGLPVISLPFISHFFSISVVYLLSSRVLPLFSGPFFFFTRAVKCPEMLITSTEIHAQPRKQSRESGRSYPRRRRTVHL